jgi:hypothetical protein
MLFIHLHFSCCVTKELDVLATAAMCNWDSTNRGGECGTKLGKLLMIIDFAQMGPVVYKVGTKNLTNVSK